MNPVTKARQKIRQIAGPEVLAVTDQWLAEMQEAEAAIEELPPEIEQALQAAPELVPVMAGLIHTTLRMTAVAEGLPLGGLPPLTALEESLRAPWKEGDHPRGRGGLWTFKLIHDMMNPAFGPRPYKAPKSSGGWDRAHPWAVTYKRGDISKTERFKSESGARDFSRKLGAEVTPAPKARGRVKIKNEVTAGSRAAQKVKRTLDRAVPPNLPKYVHPKMNVAVRSEHGMGGRKLGKGGHLVKKGDKLKVIADRGGEYTVLLPDGDFGHISKGDLKDARPNENMAIDLLDHLADADAPTKFPKLDKAKLPKRSVRFRVTIDPGAITDDGRTGTRDGVVARVAARGFDPRLGYKPTGYAVEFTGNDGHTMWDYDAHEDLESAKRSLRRWVYQLPHESNPRKPETVKPPVGSHLSNASLQSEFIKTNKNIENLSHALTIAKDEPQRERFQKLLMDEIEHRMSIEDHDEYLQQLEQSKPVLNSPAKRAR